jgi:hypothetical protein
MRSQAVGGLCIELASSKSVWEAQRERESGERSYAREQVSSDPGSVSDGLS